MSLAQVVTAGKGVVLDGFVFFSLDIESHLSCAPRG